MICTRCGRTHDDGGSFCSPSCEMLDDANKDVRHYSGRNTVEATQVAVARLPARKVLLDNGVSMLQAGKTV